MLNLMKKPPKNVTPAHNKNYTHVKMLLDYIAAKKRVDDKLQK